MAEEAQALAIKKAKFHNIGERYSYEQGENPYVYGESIPDTRTLSINLLKLDMRVIDKKLHNILSFF
jgi:hypothetical protein